MAMVFNSAPQPFVWGSGGRRLTPEEILMERKSSQALGREAMSTAPVGHWTQGLNRVVQGLMAGYDESRADQASRDNAAHSSDLVARALTGGGMPAAQPAVATSPATSPAAIPGADAIRAGLIQRGLPEPIADGFVMNFRDESGLNPSINEAKPLVPGSRGGFGLAQWTGPRRVALEQFAQQSGRPVGDVNTQLDFLVNELQGPESGAARSIMAATTPQDAAVAIARDFLRPAPQNLDRRVAQYSGGQPATTANTGISPAILELMSSPYVSDQDRKIGALLFQNQLEAQTKANDPMRMLDMQLKQGQLSAVPLEMRGKQLSNMKIERELQGEGATPLSPEERQSYGIPAEQPAYKTRTGEIKFGPAAAKITNNVGSGESAFSKKGSELQAARFNDLVSDGQGARQMMSDISTLVDLGKNIGTGKGAQFKSALGPYAEAAGVKIEGLSDIQAYESIVNRMAPALRVKGSGSQSDTELRNFLKSLPSLGNTTEGNEIVASVMQGLTQNKILAADIASKALNGEIKRSDAEKQLRELPDPMQPYRDYKAKRSKVDSLLDKYWTR